MKELLQRYAPHPLTAASALLLVVSFPPWDARFLIWVALLPWLFVISRAPTLLYAFSQGVWLSFLMTLAGFYWVASVLHHFGGVPWPLSILGLLLFGLGAQPQFLTFAPLFKLLRGRTSAFLAAPFLAAVYCALEWALPKLFVDTLGHSLYSAEYLRQAADLGGALLLTFLIFLFNYALLCIWEAYQSHKSLRLGLGSWLPQTALALVLAVGAALYGAQRKTTIDQAIAQAPAHLQAGVIQGNIGDFDKIAAERGIRGAAEAVLRTLMNLSDEALSMTPRPDVLIWPETSYPSTFRTPQTPDELARDQQVESYVRQRGVPLLFGGYDHDPKIRKDFNSFFFLSPFADGNLDLQVYHKNVLLMFGEYLPGADHIQYLRDTFPQVGNFGRGVGPVNLKIHAPVQATPVLASPVICYEALFPAYTIASARKGSQLILNITNDSWFGAFPEPQLHLALVTFRSIETRLPQLRSTNTGISALILPDGSITNPTQIGQPEIMNVSVPLIQPVPTLMKMWGDWFGPTCLVIVLAAGGFMIWASRAGSKKSQLTR